MTRICPKFVYTNNVLKDILGLLYAGHDLSFISLYFILNHLNVHRSCRHLKMLCILIFLDQKSIQYQLGGKNMPINSKKCVRAHVEYYVVLMVDFLCEPYLMVLFEGYMQSCKEFKVSKTRRKQFQNRLNQKILKRIHFWYCINCEREKCI